MSKIEVRLSVEVFILVFDLVRNRVLALTIIVVAVVVNGFRVRGGLQEGLLPL